ncbi:metastasis-associated protein MTA1 [Hyalella azteca]|uniref:Metastasis-associated protein MTA1 n=1 Tax=Hyalella azteca TaxID=294128 RepID=A0A8B7NGS9_HYAAZ|nr:metastasis-associated protein MTA1 [Hyalella azteca]
MTTNMYRVGDYVYFETSSSSPYQIRRIEELIKTPAGNVEAKVMCYYRRRDIPSHLLAVANLKHHSAFDDDPEADDADPTLALSHSNHAPHTRLMGSLPTQHSSNRSSNSSAPNITSSTPASLSVSLSSKPVTSVSPPSNSSHNSASCTPCSDISAGSSTANGTYSSAIPGSNNSCNYIPAGLKSASIRSTSSGPKKIAQVSDERSSLSEDERHQLGHRELFLSRQIETLPATHIRGKCTVTLLNETESLASYMSKEDTFFYSLVFDPIAKTLLADKGEIRIGPNYQADPTALLKEGEADGRAMSELETLVWTPDHGLTDRQIDQFLVVARSVGTFARALDCSSSVKQPSLHMSAAAASRDVTLFEAMSLLHEQDYELAKALSCLVPGSGPLLCRDQMEEWAASEANLFEEALDKYGKDFNDIRQDFLPWKTLKNIIEYYYMWKTTDRYVQQKRVKAVEAESKLKQVYIPNYNKANPAVLSNGSTNCKSVTLLNGSSSGALGFSCEGCSATTSSQWHSWGPVQKPGKLCSDCWLYWKKLGGLKKASRSAKEEEEAGMRPIVKTRNAFYLHSSPALRVMRRLARDALKRRRAARNPTTPINAVQVRHESLVRLEGRTLESLIPWLHQIKSSGRGAGSSTLKDVTLKLGQLDTYCPPWLVISPALVSKRRPQPLLPPPVTAFSTNISSGADCVSYAKDVTHAPHQQLLKRKPYQETNGIDGAPPSKRCKESSDPPLDPYRLSQLGLNPPPGLTVTPIGMNGGTPPPPPLVSSATLSSTSTRLPATTPPSTTTTPPPPYHSSHITTTPAVPVAAAAAGPRVVSQLQHAGAGRTKMATIARMSGRPRIISWMDAPDDVYFYSTSAIKTQRRTMTVTELRRAARRPWRRLLQLPLSLQQQQLQQMVNAAQIVVPVAKSTTAVPGPLPSSD